ncbi:C-24(28) sterol reductase [Thoreauomyces humboldtii]|nr:C-24(28) sterol reductase [Thoreauomyces humboldtii]
MSSPRDLEENRENEPLLASRPNVVEDAADDASTQAVASRTSGQSNRPVDAQLDREIHLEFGGPIGVSFMMLFFPTLMYYFWICIEFNDGHLEHPDSFGNIKSWFQDNLLRVAEHACPNWFAIITYTAFTVVQFALAAVMPGPVVKGMPVPSLGFKQLSYLCNGVACWYATLILSAVLHFTGVLSLGRIIDNFGPIMTVSVIAGFAITIATYLYAVLSGDTHRMSGYMMYDMFMGAVLNPRVLTVDLKMWAEIRIPWVLLFYLTVSAAVKEHETTGSVRPEVWFMVLAHFLYVNACMKGEECIPTTWDIFYEK